MTEHTPGPWEADSHMQWVVAGTRVVATIGGATREEAKANARLIAAAPELLEALQWAVEFINPQWLPETDGWLPQATAAIAKALGQEVAP